MFHFFRDEITHRARFNFNATFNISTLNFKSFFSVCFLIIYTLLHSGCALNNRTVSGVSQQMKGSLSVEQALVKVQKIDCDDNDLAQHQLNTGYLQLLNGDFYGAIESLEQAKGIMESLQAVSVSENLSSATINETLRSYTGWPTDRALVHGMMALAYLLNQDLAGARVEVLQADTLMKHLAESGDLLGQLAFVHYISGVVYELNDETDNALVSYRFAYNTLNNHSEAIPMALKVSLLKLSHRLGLKDEYSDYKSQFGLGIENLNSSGNQQQFVFYFDGVISQMEESRISLWYAPDDVFLSIAIPRYAYSDYNEDFVKIDVLSTHLETETIELLDKRVRDDLAGRMPAITATALVRASAKYALVHEMNKQDPMLGAFANVFTLISEVSDLRHWTLLPAAIQIARFSSGAHNFQLTSRKATQEVVTTAENTKQIVFVSSLTEQVFTAKFSN